jgi:hypothetical protein
MERSVAHRQLHVPGCRRASPDKLFVTWYDELHLAGGKLGNRF